jgi:hypothetical protein
LLDDSGSNLGFFPKKLPIADSCAVLLHQQLLEVEHNFVIKQTDLKLGFWYPGYGGETNVLLDCGRFYGIFVRPRVSMRERMNE